MGGFCAQCLAVSQMSKGGDGDRFKCTMAELLLKRFLPTLHAPFAMRARENQAFRGSLEVYLSSTLAILSPDLDHDFLRLLVVGGGIFKSCVINASLIASKEMIATAEAERLMNQGKFGEDRLSTENETLNGAFKAALLLAEKRLRSGETNVKLFSTLHMALGHVTALQVGAPVQLAIAKHAKFALEKALETLKAQDVPQHSQPAEPFQGDGFIPSAEDALDDYSSYTYHVDFTSATSTSFYQSAFEPAIWYG